MTDRAFGLAFAVVFGVITAIAWLFWGRLAHWTIAVSASFLVLALIAPGVLLPLNRFWTWLAHRIGFVTNHLFLGVFFFFVIVPVGIAARLFGITTFERRPDSRSESYWRPVERQATAETYSDMF